MTTITEKKEKKMLSLLKGDNRSGLKVEVGPDHRLRLVLDRGKGGSKQGFIQAGYLARYEIESLTNEGMFDGHGDDDFEL